MSARSAGTWRVPCVDVAELHAMRAMHLPLPACGERAGVRGVRESAYTTLTPTLSRKRERASQVGHERGRERSMRLERASEKQDEGAGNGGAGDPFNGASPRSAATLTPVSVGARMRADNGDDRIARAKYRAGTVPRKCLAATIRRQRGGRHGRRIQEPHASRATRTSARRPGRPGRRARGDPGRHAHACQVGIPAVRRRRQR